MDIPKMKGLLDAIEAESISPQPSHANLARLVAMFMRALVAEYEKPSMVVIPPPETQTVGSTSGKVSLNPFKKRVHKKK